MSEEKKIDLSSFDGIADRVARAKAKAEAIKAARAAGGTHAAPAAPPPEAPAATQEAPPAAQASAETVESKVDLSNLDAIPDRVARAKAKAEAIKAARAAGGAAPKAPAAPGPPAPEPPATQEPAESAEGKVDLSNLDAITDRVARAKAKAEAIKAARAAGGAHPAAPPRAGAPVPKREVSAEAIAAKKAQAKSRTETPAATPSPAEGNGAAFCEGMVVRRNGKLAKIISTKYENVCLVYEDNPREKVMTKRYRLDAERQRGQLQFASVQEFQADIPSGVGKWGRRAAFLVAAGLTGVCFLGMGLWIGPLNLFPTIPVGYILFALAHHLTK